MAGREAHALHGLEVKEAAPSPGLEGWMCWVGFLLAEGEFHFHALSSQMASGGTLAGGNTMFSSCLQLTVQTCGKKKKTPKNSSSSTAPHRVSSQNAKCYHSAQADSVFQVREQSEVPFSTFSSTSLKMI